MGFSVDVMENVNEHFGQPNRSETPGVGASLPGINIPITLVLHVSLLWGRGESGEEQGFFLKFIVTAASCQSPLGPVCYKIKELFLF